LAFPLCKNLLARGFFQAVDIRLVDIEFQLFAAASRFPASRRVVRGQLISFNSTKIYRDLGALSIVVRSLRRTLARILRVSGLKGIKPLSRFHEI
jgi:hypothetical protein